jgi:hypothetical protein
MISEELEYDGKRFKNFSTLAGAYRLKAEGIKNKLHKGLTLDEAVDGLREKKQREKVIYQGVRYLNLRHLTERKNADYPTVVRLLKRGFSMEEALKGKRITGREIIYQGFEYKTIGELARTLDLAIPDIKWYLSEGYSVDQSVDMLIMRQRDDNSGNKYSSHGKEYKSLASLGRELRIKVAELRSYPYGGRDLSSIVDAILLKKKSRD